MTAANPIAIAVRRREWERVALYVLIGVARAARSAPPGTLEDLLALLAEENGDASSNE